MKPPNPAADGVKKAQAGPLRVDVQQADPFEKREELITATQDADGNPAITIKVIDGEIWELWVWAPVSRCYWENRPTVIFDHSVIEFGRPFLDLDENAKTILFAPFRLKIEAAIDIREERALFVTSKPGKEEAEKLARNWIRDCGYQVDSWGPQADGYPAGTTLTPATLSSAFRRRLSGADLVVFSPQLELDATAYQAWIEALRHSNVPVLIASAIRPLMDPHNETLLPLEIDLNPHYHCIRVVRAEISAGFALDGRPLRILPPASAGQPQLLRNQTATFVDDSIAPHKPFSIADAILSPPAAAPTPVHAAIVAARPATQRRQWDEPAVLVAPRRVSAPA